jgi:protein-arginine kinase activator protein McsA
MVDKFKENFLSLNEIFNITEVVDYLIDKKAFTEKFMRMIYESNELTKLTNIRLNKTKNFKVRDYKFNINNVDNNYHISYDDKKKKIIVNISENSLFSYYDSIDEIQMKLNHLILKEDYENAQILYNFIKKLN